MEPIQQITSKNVQYIYLLREREFIRLQENVFKLGKTKQLNEKRFVQYQKDSVMLLQMACNDCDANEKQLLKIFKKKYKQRTEYGIEYFEGDYRMMMIDIYNMNIKDLMGELIIDAIEDSLSSSVIQKTTIDAAIDKSQTIAKPTHKYKCSKCNFQTNYKQSYNKHITRKTKCGKESLTCGKCKKIFNTKNSLYSHYNKICKTTKTKTTTTTTIGDIIPTTLNIIDGMILPYGNENLSYITGNDMQHILESGEDYIKSYLDLVHLNANHKENYNVHVSDDKLGCIKLWDGQDWLLEEPHTFYLNIFKKVHKLIEDLHRQFNVQLPNEIVEYNKLLEEYEKTMDCLDDTMSETKKNVIIKQIKAIMINLYNHRKKVLDEHEKIKKTISERPSFIVPPTTTVRRHRSSSDDEDEDDVPDEIVVNPKPLASSSEEESGW